MTDKKMWVCTGRYGTWIPCPESPLQANSSSIVSEVRLLNGGSVATRTLASRRQYDMAWRGSIADLEPVKSLYEGLYGDGPYYFLDPTAKSNYLPPHWAAPHLSGNNRWPRLVRGVDPVRIPTTVSSIYKPPPLTAVYTFPTEATVFNARTPRCTLPIPEGSTLRLRAWGSVTGTAAIKIRCYDRTTDAVTEKTLIPSVAGTQISIGGSDPGVGSPLYPSTTLFPSTGLYPSEGFASYTGPYYSRVEIWLAKTGTAAATLTLAALLAELDTNSVAWTSGKGVSGLEFSTDLTNTTYRSSASGSQAMSASMVEVGSWQQ